MRPIFTALIRAACIAVICCIVMPWSAQAQTTSKSEKSDIEIEAFYSQGQLDTWHLHITRNGVAHLQFFAGRGNGQALGNFYVNTEKLQSLLSTGPLRSFDELPPKLVPTRALPFHTPHYQIKVRTKGQEHEVNVHFPADIERSPDLDHFWAAWHGIWALVPIRPPADTESKPANTPK